MNRYSPVFFALVLALGLPLGARPAAAEDILCDPSFENCRARLLQLIDNETVGIDVAFWFMEDARYTAALIRRAQAGVPIRVLVDPRANPTYTHNAARLQELEDAGIPMRKRVASGILHWKMMMFDGQNTVQFSAANYSAWAFTPISPYTNYIDEIVYFTSQDSIVNSFRTKYDTLWTDTTRYADHANVTEPLTARYPGFPKDPELNFPPSESFRNRSVGRYNAENAGIDVIMYRITDRAHTDGLIRARERGVPVRLYTEQMQYRDPARLWHSWNVDRLYMAGVTIRHRAHEGLNHQKSVILHGQQLVIFGSSNWTGPSTDSQEEHNYFTYKPHFYEWFTSQFERKWNNATGYLETEPFAPLPPDRPGNVAPAHLAAHQSTSAVTLRWNGGPWAHVYDVYFGTTPEPPLYAEDVELGPSLSTTNHKQLVVSDLNPGTTYYWRVVGKTMAQLTRAGPIHSFTTTGAALPPPPSATLGPGDILMHGARATTQGNWSVVSDATAAGGMRLFNPDRGRPKVNAALANPADYAELTFTPEAGQPYRLWIRARAHNDHWANDSVYVQFSGSVTASGAPAFRIGTTSSTTYSLEPCSGCGVAAWGWEDNGWGVNVMGPPIYFADSGPQTIRIQPREDGISIDQILLSPERYMNASPGALKNDTTILQESDGSGTPPPPPPTPPAPEGEVVLYAAGATITGADWRVVADPSAAGGQAMQNPDAGRPRVNTALAAPASYVEMTFTADAYVPYRLWIRGRAHNNHWANDSVHVQFSGSVTPEGTPLYRIGTTSSTVVSLEECSGCGVAGWGWEDNGWGSYDLLGPEIYFAAAGPQTIRIQAREDGLTIDQIVLSASAYLTTRPGAPKNDTTILTETGGIDDNGDDGSEPPPPPPPPPPPTSSGDIVLHAASGSITGGAWAVVADASAAGSLAMHNPDEGRPKVATAELDPASYFEMTFEAEAGIPYRLWIRGRAHNNHWANDSVHVQFSGAVDASSGPMYRMGTASSAEYNLEECSGCGLSSWGWEDNGWGSGVLGPQIFFAESGPQTIRVQTREDGIFIDQILLSPSTYLHTSPGALKNDTTILPASTGSHD